jgi:putative NIF3 family GTP cyclohydrolase 1 type 2
LGASRSAIEANLNRLLDVGPLRDYGTNGLQVEGRAGISTLVSGVTASRALIEAVIQYRADTIPVHHGLP